MKPLCPAPFVGMTWRGTRNPDAKTLGMWRSCCDCGTEKYGWSPTKVPTFDELWNNPMAVEIRETLAKGEWHPNCERCKIAEEQFGRSSRNRFWEEVEKHNLELGKLQFFDYRPSNLCNLKCRMCDSVHSNLIAKEKEDDRFIFDMSSPKDPMIDIVDWSQVKRLKLLGGEPMIMEETLDILAKVPEDCSLQITTNGFKIPEKVEKALVECKAHIHINASLDAVGDTYNYIRTNSNWEKVRTNILRLRDYNKFEIGVTPVGMIWNAFNLEETIDWVREEGLIFGNIHWEGRRWNRLGLLTPEHKTELIGITNPLDKLLSETFHDREYLLDVWRRETKRLDEMRGTNILDLDERFGEYL